MCLLLFTLLRLTWICETVYWAVWTAEGSPLCLFKGKRFCNEAARGLCFTESRFLFAAKMLKFPIRSIGAIINGRETTVLLYSIWCTGSILNRHHEHLYINGGFHSRSLWSAHFFSKRKTMPRQRCDGISTQNMNIYIVEISAYAAFNSRIFYRK